MMLLRYLALAPLLLSATVALAAGSKNDKLYTQAPEICPHVRPDSDGQATGEQFKLLPGFQVERLFTVPKEELGSWVSIALDDKGRIIASDQRDKGLCRITPPAIGSREPTRVEHLRVEISSAQGMLQAFGALYVSRNGKGLFRLQDTDGDDQYDEVVLLKELRGGGEHGEHALRLSADGKSILLLAGNGTRPPFDRSLNAPVQTMGGVRSERLKAVLPAGFSSRLIPNWDEDLLTVRQWDPEGFMAGVLAPGGWIAKTDPEGKQWELIASGFRNPYDMALNADGELFAYDADMEGDAGLPWYRPTRVCHATSGSESGWRSGSGKWPAYFVDSLPAVVDIGLGSPVGVEFGYGAKFPAKYQRALFLCDFTSGAIYAVHLEPSGASYTGVKETLLSRNALPLTDAVVGKDGALYFTVGGRNNQSELYRVTYIGTEPTAPVDARHASGAKQRALRRELETYHRPGADPAIAVPLLVKHLASSDRFIRYAARVGLEHIPARHWMTSVLDSQQADVVITGIVGLARSVETDEGPKLIARLRELNFRQLTATQQVECLRAFELVLIRTGLPDGPGTLATGSSMTGTPAASTHANTIGRPRLLPGPKTVELGGYFEQFFPSSHELVNRELATLMVALESPQAARLLVRVLSTGQLDSVDQPHGASEQLQIEIAYQLRNLQIGWNSELRKAYFTWFEKAHAWKAGNRLRGYLTNIDNQAFDNLSASEKILVEATGQRKPFKVPALPKPEGPGKDYVLDELVGLISAPLKDRDFQHGKNTFAAARCIICHRFAGEGGATGPDLTQAAGRFSIRDLLESIVDPSKVISDQYQTMNLVTTSGKVLTGRVISVSDNSITLLVDPEDSTKLVTIPRSEIEEESPSPVSLMPKDLLKPLNREEILDLAAFLLSRGNKNDRYFKKSEKGANKKRGE